MVSLNRLKKAYIVQLNKKKCEHCIFNDGDEEIFKKIIKTFSGAKMKGY